MKLYSVKMCARARKFCVYRTDTGKAVEYYATAQEARSAAQELNDKKDDRSWLL